MIKAKFIQIIIYYYVNYGVLSVREKKYEVISELIILETLDLNNSALLHSSKYNYWRRCTKIIETAFFEIFEILLIYQYFLLCVLKIDTLFYYLLWNILMHKRNNSSSVIGFLFPIDFVVEYINPLNVNGVCPNNFPRSIV